MTLAIKPMDTRVPLAPAAESCIHLWFRATRAGTSAAIWLEGPEGRAPLAETKTHADFIFVEARLGSHSAALAWESGATQVSCVYAFDPERVSEEGVRFAYVAPATRNPDLPESYHFRPPLGWMNDPNGFCRVGDTYHLFYQHYPHGLRWRSMHWGHAVSRDLLTWTHLPIFLQPHPEVEEHHGGRGGVYSGSAVALPSGRGLRVFYTDSAAGRQPAPQYQRTAIARDGVMAGSDEIIIAGPPPGQGLGTDFRDPFVFRGLDGGWLMLLGSADAEGGALLLYRTDDAEARTGWTFASVLHRDGRMSTRVMECPAMVPLGPRGDPETLWALIYAQLGSTDPRTGRRNLSTALVGRFDGESFAPAFEREFDFGTGFYAFQAFEDEGSPVGIAWLANWTSWDRASDFPTAMTLPLRLTLAPERDALLVHPIPAVERLRRDELDAEALLRGAWLPLPQGTAEVVLDLAASGLPVRLEIAHPDGPLSVLVGPEGLEIAHEKPTPRLIALGAQPARLRIFLDTGSIEVFADDGRWSGTHRVPGAERFTAIRLVADRADVAAARAWDLAPPTPGIAS